MKKFSQLNVGDTIYKCNYMENYIESYEVVDITNSSFSNQKKLMLHKNNEDKKFYTDFYTNYVTDVINVFDDNSSEYLRYIIGHDENTLWCADRDAVRETFDKYKENILKKLNEQEIMINTL